MGAWLRHRGKFQEKSFSEERLTHDKKKKSSKDPKLSSRKSLPKKKNSTTECEQNSDQERTGEESSSSEEQLTVEQHKKKRINSKGKSVAEDQNIRKNCNRRNGSSHATKEMDESADEGSTLSETSESDSSNSN